MKEDEAVRRLSARRRRVGPEVNEAPNWSPSISLPGTGAVAGRFSLGKGAGTGAGQLQKKKEKRESTQKLNQAILF